MTVIQRLWWGSIFLILFEFSWWTHFFSTEGCLSLGIFVFGNYCSYFISLYFLLPFFFLPLNHFDPWNGNEKLSQRQNRIHNTYLLSVFQCDKLHTYFMNLRQMRKSSDLFGSISFITTPDLKTTHISSPNVKTH
jgi:hypothetical protein